MNFPVIDLHCDLLSYLERSSQRSPFDSAVHCSIPQLKEGGVKLQVLAVFTQTAENSVVSAGRQIEIYHTLPSDYPDAFSFYTCKENLQQTQSIQILTAIENASGLWTEKEPFQSGWKRLQTFIRSSAKPLYIGLTWHAENRFGGGNATQVGLKEDGKQLLEELHCKNIAIDLSHASDALADGILDYLEYKNLSVPILASHSNARSVINHPRNLPDTLAKEVFKRKGVIGLNFYKGFVGEQEEDFIRHLEHWLEIGGEQHICLGADFFYEGDLGQSPLKKPELPYFAAFQDASSYPKLLDVFKQNLGLSESQLKALAFQNAEKFIHATLAI